jgi:hypothetical protein
MMRRRPGKSANANKVPTGIPIIRLIKVALHEILSDSRVMATTSTSSEARRWRAVVIPSKIRSIKNQSSNKAGLLPTPEDKIG